MKRLNAILVPTDFSPHSEHALHYAASLGKRFGATIHLLHVVTLEGLESGQRSDFPDIGPLLQRADKVAQARLDEGPAQQYDSEVSVIKSLTRAVSAPEAIVNYASRKSIDLIVIATRGNTGLRKILLGSVTERVVGHAPCPVLVVEAGERDFVNTATSEITLRLVVLADNLARGPLRALEEAARFLAPYRPEVHFVHAVETEMPPIYGLSGVDSVFSVYPDLREKLDSMLCERVQSVVPEGWKTQTAVREGKPFRVVSDYAREVEADLLIVASETRTDLEEWVVGGTTERIVRHAPCPTLVI
jgi:nucleotide-binding universal stress UspA family protein